MTCDMVMMVVEHELKSRPVGAAFLGVAVDGAVVVASA